MQELDQLERADFIISELKRLGISVPPASRIAQYGTAAMGRPPGDTYIAPQNPRFKPALEGLRDISSLYLALNTCTSLEGDPRYIENLRRIVKDSDLPEKDRLHSPGRDAQLEILVAASCLLGKMTNVHFSSPDVLCQVGDQPWAIEVKRLKSRNGLDGRIRKACNQIRKSSLPGVIFIDISLAENEDNQPLNNADRTANIHQRLQEAFQWYVNREGRNLLQRTQGSGVALIYIFFSIPHFEQEGGWDLKSMVLELPTHQTSRCSPEQIESFKTSLGVGIDAWQ